MRYRCESRDGCNGSATDGDSRSEGARYRRDLSVKHSRKSRSITSWVSISASDAARVTIEPGRHSCAREIPQGSSAVIGGLGTWRRIEAWQDMFSSPIEVNYPDQSCRSLERLTIGSKDIVLEYNVPAP